MRTCIFKVKGRGAFPLDMLRHDCCYPHKPDDAETIGESIDYASPSFSLREVRTIELVRHSEGRKGGLLMPTEGRWLSFGWTVIETDYTA